MIELDLALQRGEFSLELAIATPVRAPALFGHSGCGQTSPLLAMAGLLFQAPRLFPPLSVRANLRYGMPRGAAPATFDDAVSLLGLSALLKRKPGELSGGQARRVAIGRALLRQPHALLLDEPLANLHREARAEVLQHLVRLKQEFALTTVMVSHQHDEVAALADAVALIDDGRLAALQDIAAFRATPAAPYAATAAPDRCAAR